MKKADIKKSRSCTCRLSYCFQDLANTVIDSKYLDFNFQYLNIVYLLKCRLNNFIFLLDKYFMYRF